MSEILRDCPSQLKMSPKMLHKMVRLSKILSVALTYMVHSDAKGKVSVKLSFSGVHPSSASSHVESQEGAGSENIQSPSQYAQNLAAGRQTLFHKLECSRALIEEVRSSGEVNHFEHTQTFTNFCS